MDEHPTQYQKAVETVLKNGSYEKNRTGVDTIASFGVNYSIDISQGYPLLTTKKMDTFRWNSMISEFVWYLSGEHHIRNLTEKTSIWDAWADENNNLPTAYGRFWRKFPLPDEGQHKEGEWWVNNSNFPEMASKHYDSVSKEEVQNVVDRWINEDGTLDQLSYAVDTLRGENPLRPPESRRIVITAWHPGNATVSHLPPCHFEYVINIQDDKLNVHLTQRSADMALGVPFNIATYALLMKVLARVTGYKVGEFSHTLVSSHIYCGKGERGEWYSNNLDKLQNKIPKNPRPEDYKKIRDYILSSAPEEESSPENNEYGYDHVPGLLEQLSREPNNRPSIKLNLEENSGVEGLNSLTEDQIQLQEYNSHSGLSFNVAE